METAVAFIIAVVTAEAIAEILSTSVILAPCRAFASRIHPLLGIFSECGYCASVWISIGLSYALRLHLDALAVLGAWEGLCLGLCVHRASNVWHELISRWHHRLPWRFHITGQLPLRHPEPLEGTHQPKAPTPEGTGVET